MEQLSTTASDQSIWSPRASQSSRAKWIRSQTPVRCQSGRRRQHVIPDPHPSSCGSICQGMPLRRTKTMPVRHARCETRGRPPLGHGGGIGKNGSTESHNRSGSSSAATAVHPTSPKRIRFRRFCLHALRDLHRDRRRPAIEHSLPLVHLCVPKSLAATRKTARNGVAAAMYNSSLFRELLRSARHRWRSQAEHLLQRRHRRTQRPEGR
jgi:hypothetical protein